MKKLFTLIALAITLFATAQAPQGFNYQATVRNSSGTLITNQNVLFKFNIMLNSQTSLPIYSETHFAPTDDLGQVNLIIGLGTATIGSFSSINWGNGSYYLGIELNTGSGFVAMGTTQLLSVPFALYANSAGNSQSATPNLETVLSVNNSANNQQIKNLADPTDAQDAVTKEYLENLIADLQNQINSILSQLPTPCAELPKLAVVGNHQGWSPSSAPRIAASDCGQTDYEGYVWLNGGFKFVGPDSVGNYYWGNIDWGDNGQFAGILAESGESDCFANAGYYRVRVNTVLGTYSIESVSWGIIGAATPSGWDSDTDFIYNPNTQKLEIENIYLTPGLFKFRGNNQWGNGFEFGAVNANGYLINGETGLSFNGPAGNYKVILDLSNPRKYTYELIAL